MTASTSLSLDDYDAIAAAVMETERGRWFLAEFARRNRAADTAAVLEALAAVEARLSERSPPQHVESAGLPAALAGRLEAVADEAARMREALTALPRQGRHVVRALRRCDELERSIELALAETGAPRSARLSAPRAALVEPDARRTDENALDAPDTARAQAAASDKKVDATTDDAFAASLAAELFAPELFAPEVFTAEPSHDDRDDEAPGSARVNGSALHEPPVRAPETPPAAAPERSEPAPEPVSARMNGSALYDSVHKPSAAHIAAERSSPRLETAEPPATAPTPIRPTMPKAWTPGLLETLSAEERAILFA